jgi:NADH-quinone oxidoreductase subunit C
MLPEQVAGNEVAAGLNAALPGALLGGGVDRGGDLFVEASAAWIMPVLHYCKEKAGLDRLAVTAVDWYPAEPRFELIYLLHAVPRALGDIGSARRFRVKVRVGSGDEIDSACGVYQSANWYEREIFDLFGVNFRNHPNLARILMPEGWDGHPLRKDYPIHGFKYSYKDE